MIFLAFALASANGSCDSIAPVGYGTVLSFTLKSVHREAIVRRNLSRTSEATAHLFANTSTFSKAESALKKLYLGSARTDNNGSAGSFRNRERSDLGDDVGRFVMKEAGKNRSAP